MASGNPAKKAAERKISQVGDFKKRVESIQELPSGLVVKLRNPGGLKAFIGSKNGKNSIPNSLMPIIQKALKSGQGVDIEKELLKDGEMDMDLVQDMLGMMDGIAIQCLVEPRLYPELTQKDLDKHNEELPEDEQLTDPEELRRDDRLYVDELPQDDKQFIFSWISSGVTDLESFRQQRQSGVDALAAVTSPEGNPQS
jgi:hypothetical protein